ncbi:MAG TPA: DinB family protein [Thermomicrobiales bacterium]
MPGKAMLRTMFDYNAATNVRLLDGAAKVSDEQLDTPTGYSVGSLRQTLWHTLIVEAGWGRFCRGIEVDRTKPPPIEPTAVIADFQAFQSEESAQIRPFLDGLGDDDLAATLTRKNPDGTERTFIRWQVLMHILYHSAQHRSEAAELLTRYGQSPGDTDFIFFVAPRR